MQLDDNYYQFKILEKLKKIKSTYQKTFQILLKKKISILDFTLKLYKISSRDF